MENNTNKIIQSYLIDYVLYLKNHKIKEDYNILIKLQNNIENFLNRCCHKYDGLSKLINIYDKNKYWKKYNKICYQYGGNISNKVDKIIQIAVLFKELQAMKLPEKTKQITERVDTLVKKINELQDKTVIDKDKFLNDLETVLPLFIAENNRINLKIRRNELYLVPEIKIDDEKIKSLSDIINEFSNSIDETEKKIKETDNQQSELDIITDEFKKNIKKFEETIKDDNTETIKKFSLNLDVKLKELSDSIEDKMTEEKMEEYKKKIKQNTQLFKNIKSLTFLANKNNIEPLKDKLEKINSKSLEEKCKLLNDFFNPKPPTESSLVLQEGIIPGPVLKNYPIFLNEFTAPNDSNIVKANDTITDSQITLLRQMLKLKNDKEPELGEIYKPNLIKYKEKSLKGGGGVLETSNITQLINENRMEITKKIAKLEEYKKYIELVKEYNKKSFDSYIHTLYLTAIVTNKLSGGGTRVYIFINKGIVEFYKRTLNEIVKHFVENTQTQIIKYLRKYHYVTIHLLNNFMNTLSEIMDPRDIIDISRCKGIALQRIILLNYFKEILTSYKSMYQNQVTIYARINDIMSQYQYNDDGIKNETTDNTYDTGKMFASDYDRKNINKLNLTINYDESILENKKDAVDTSLMYVRSNACTQLKGKQIEKFKFTEVYDTDNFQDSEEISKSMLLDVNLSEGKSIALMTYGYSGTGKTYTLFGKTTKDDNGKITENISGILQTTLKNIKGLKSLKLRIFELYGYGQVYPFYWNQGEDDKIKQEINNLKSTDKSTQEAEREYRKQSNKKKSNLDMIKHFVISYALKLTQTNDENDINIANDKSINILSAEKIADFIDNQNIDGTNNEFIEINGTSEIEKYFKSFDKLVEEIENKRRKGHEIPIIFENIQEGGGLLTQEEIKTLKSILEKDEYIKRLRVWLQDKRLYEQKENDKKKIIDDMITEINGTEIIKKKISQINKEKISQEKINAKQIVLDKEIKDFVRLEIVPIEMDIKGKITRSLPIGNIAERALSAEPRDITSTSTSTIRSSSVAPTTPKRKTSVAPTTQLVPPKTLSVLSTTTIKRKPSVAQTTSTAPTTLKKIKHYTVRTVRDTPNNVTSSRSVLVYDFRIKTNDSDKYTTLLIIDLPGKEEIIDTYIDPYYDNKIIKQILQLKYKNDFENQLIFLKAMTASMSLNPMLLPLFSVDIDKLNTKSDEKTPINDIIYDIFNNELNDNERKNILNKELKLANYDIHGKIEIKSVIYANEIVNLKQGTLKGVNFVEISEKNKIDCSGHGIYTNKQQGKIVGGIHLINRLALTGRFDVIEKIYEKYMEYYVNFFEIKKKEDNKYNIIYKNKEIDIETKFTIDDIKKFKGGLINELTNNKSFSNFNELYEDKNESEIIEMYTNLFQYDYYLTPLEGIYINENIVGLVKYLAEVLTVNDKDKENKLKKIAPEQDKSLSFIEKQQEARYKLIMPSIKNISQIKDDIKTFIKYDPGLVRTSDPGLVRKSDPELVEKPEEPFFIKESDNIKYNYDSIKQTYDKFKSSYNSNNIYNFNKPIITDVLNPYLENKEAKTEKDIEENETKIKDFKVFYLFGNYANNAIRELKCKNQYNLLDKTRSFIDIVK